jgi:hypothetical protein
MFIFSMRVFFVLSILFFSSCTSLNKEQELLKVEISDPVNNVVKIILDSCYQAKKPQFLADFSSESMLSPPFEMEGVWENNYDLLKTSVIGPLGEEYLSFDIKGYELNYNNQSNLLTSNVDFEKVSSLIATIGAKGLRGFLCGRFAFQFTDKNNGIYIVNDRENFDSLSEMAGKKKISEKNVILNKKYFSISTYNISGHNIEIQSHVSLTKKGEGYGVFVNSRFYYGLFSQDAQVEVKWTGFVNSNTVFPTSTVFRTMEDTYVINFNEYQ